VLWAQGGFALSLLKKRGILGRQEIVPLKTEENPTIYIKGI